MTHPNRTEASVFALIGRGAAMVGCAVVIFLAGQMVDLVKTVAATANAVVSQSIEIKELRIAVEKGTADRYKAADATRDFQARDRAIEAVMSRVARLETGVGGRR